MTLYLAGKEALDGEEERGGDWQIDAEARKWVLEAFDSAPLSLSSKMGECLNALALKASASAKVLSMCSLFNVQNAARII